MLTVKYSTNNGTTTTTKTLVEKEDLFPVGSIYLTVSSVSPASRFGGTWQRISGRFLLGADTNHTVKSTGGSETQKLTAANLPPHGHQLPTLYQNLGGNDDIYLVEEGKGMYAAGSSSNDDRAWTTTTGNGNSFSIMPPYIAVYIWQRTA